jgi:WD40 repeat protein
MTESCGQLLKRTRAQRSDGAREPGPTPASLSSLSEWLLYHTLSFVDETDDARCRGISQSWARLRRAWVLASNPLGPVSSVAFSCDGAHLAVGTEDDVLTIHDAATGEPRRSLQRSGWVSCLAFSPTDSTVLVAGGSRDVIAYNTATGNSRELWRTAGDNFGAVKSVAVSPVGTTIAFCHQNMAVVIDIGGHDPTRALFTPARVLAQAPDSVAGLAFSATGAVLAVGVGTKIKCFDVATGQTGRVLTEIELGFRVWTVAYLPGGTVAGGGGEKLAFYDASNGQLIREMPANTHACMDSTTCFSHDGSMVTVAAQNSSFENISILDAETGEVRHDIKRENFIGAATFSPDGKALAIGDLDGRVRCRVALYDVATGARRRMQRQPQASPAAPTA